MTQQNNLGSKYCENSVRSSVKRQKKVSPRGRIVETAPLVVQRDKRGNIRMEKLKVLMGKKKKKKKARRLVRLICSVGNEI